MPATDQCQSIQAALRDFTSRPLLETVLQIVRPGDRSFRPIPPVEHAPTALLNAAQTVEWGIFSSSRRRFSAAGISAKVRSSRVSR